MSEPELELVWQEIQQEARRLVDGEPMLASFSMPPS